MYDKGNPDTLPLEYNIKKYRPLFTKRIFLIGSFNAYPNCTTKTFHQKVKLIFPDTALVVRFTNAITLPGFFAERN